MIYSILLCLISCFVALTFSGHGYSEDDLEYLAHLNFDDLPRDIRIKLGKESRTGDTSHWCCKNGQDIHLTYKTIYKTQLLFQKISTRFKTGSHHCGFLGTGRCSSYDIRYKQKTVTNRIARIIPNQQDCPDHLLICCKDYIMIAENCYHMDKIKEVTDNIIQMKNMGILLTAGQIVG